MTLNKRMDICFYGGLIIAMFVIIIGLMIAYHYKNPWIAIAGELVALAISFTYIDLIVKFVKVKESTYNKVS